MLITLNETQQRILDCCRRWMAGATHFLAEEEFAARGITKEMITLPRENPELLSLLNLPPAFRDQMAKRQVPGYLLEIELLPKRYSDWRMSETDLVNAGLLETIQEPMGELPRWPFQRGDGSIVLINRSPELPRCFSEKGDNGFRIWKDSKTRKLIRASDYTDSMKRPNLEKKYRVVYTIDLRKNGCWTSHAIEFVEPFAMHGVTLTPEGYALARPLPEKAVDSTRSIQKLSDSLPPRRTANPLLHWRAAPLPTLAAETVDTAAPSGALKESMDDKLARLPAKATLTTGSIAEYFDLTDRVHALRKRLARLRFKNTDIAIDMPDAGKKEKSAWLVHNPIVVQCIREVSSTRPTKRI